MLQLAWITNHERKYCVLFSDAALEISVVQRPNPRVGCPVIKIGYSLDELTYLAPLFGTMNTLSLIPEVYMWDERTKSPKICVFSRISNPSRELMRSLLGLGDCDTAHLVERTCDEVICVEEGILRPEDVGIFSIHFADFRKAFVLVSADEARDAEGVVVLQSFEIGTIIRRKPEAIIV